MDSIKRLLAQGQFHQALEQLRTILQSADNEERKEALYYSAVAHRYLGELSEADQYLSTLTQQFPEYGRAFQELGHARKAQHDNHTALHHYYVAVRLNPALYASWKSAAEIEQQIGNTEQAALNQQQVNFLSQQPKEVLAALNLYHEGKLYKAEKICRAFLQRNPHHIEAMRTLANIGVQLDVLNDAEFLLESVLVLAPNYLLARHDYVKVLQRRQKHREALDNAGQLIDAEPDNPVYQALYANLCATLDKNEQAFSLYQQLLNRNDVDRAGIYVAKGHLHKALGEQQQAVACYQQAYQQRQDFGDAYWSLANLKTYRFSSDEVNNMEAAQADSSTFLVDRIHLCFALAKAYEQQDKIEQSFELYSRGNELKRQNSHFKPNVLSERIQAQKEFFTPQRVSQLQTQAKRFKQADVTPIFIVGLPRAGSTLVEQILASHSSIEATMELPNLPAIAHGLNGRQVQSEKPKYPYVLEELAADKVAGLATRYLQETTIYRTGQPFFIDKMPNNFRHIGLIKALFPDAKIIDARRDPMDCCFSAFKQLFAEGQEFSYGLDMLATYYRDYIDLMAHWRAVYPGDIHTVIHEQLVEQPELTIKSLFDYLDIPFEEQCLRPHEQQRSVKTASSEQVRQPINSKGIGQWRLFEKQLAPLKTALGDLVSRWDTV